MKNGITLVSAITLALMFGGCEVVENGTTIVDETATETQTSQPTTTTTTTKKDSGDKTVYTFTEKDGNKKEEDNTPKVEDKSKETPKVALESRIFKQRVSSKYDDAEEYPNGRVNMESSDLEMVKEEHGEQLVGIRFDKVSIPQGAKITKATIRFTVDERSSETTDLIIQIENSTDAKRFQKEYYNISNRKLLDDSVSWSPEPWEIAGESKEAETTPDLRELLQKIVSKDDWKSGNAVVFVISGEGKRVAQSFDGAEDGAPELYVEYEADRNSIDDEETTEQDSGVDSSDESNNSQDDSTEIEDKNNSTEDTSSTTKEREDETTTTTIQESPKGNRDRDNLREPNRKDEIKKPNRREQNGNQDDNLERPDSSKPHNKPETQQEPDTPNIDDNNKNFKDDSTTESEDKKNKREDESKKTENTPDNSDTVDEAKPLVSMVRLSWDYDPAHTAVVGFTPKDGKNYRVIYGYSTDESLWDSKDATISHTFNRSLVTKFARLENLKAGSDVFFRVCNGERCGKRMWFKTAPEGDKPFVFVAGGDTRSGWSTRRAGNKLISKIRPLFVMHGGDFTNGNSAREMKSLLLDWTLAYSQDKIEGRDYTRVYPIVPAHGNHEDGNLRTLCEVFGIDGNRDGECTKEDTYGAFSVGSLLRVYTLNSQFKYSQWSSEASEMNSWLRKDLQDKGAKAQWRVVQYHKPMFPHYSKKHTNPTLQRWWAELFYESSVNLVVESDTHIAKVTTTIKPNGDGFVATTKGGTLYVGEGSWGAPARSANRPYDWTLDLASIQQFKVVTVKKSEMDVRTAQFDGRVTGVTREERANDSTVLPTGVNWWSVGKKGKVLKLTPTAEKRSHLE
jgi:hypothetical protein